MSTACRLRLCLLKLWSNFNGFGFVLTADSQHRRLYVEHVEDSSPAKAGGLHPGDRIIEVTKAMGTRNTRTFFFKNVSQKCFVFCLILHVTTSCQTVLKCFTTFFANVLDTDACKRNTKHVENVFCYTAIFVA